MAVIWFLRFLRGYVTIDITSAFTERFLNMCWARQIKLWDIIRMSEDTVRVCMLKSDFKEASSFFEKCMCTVSVVGEKGALKSLAPFSKRYFLVAAAALCMGACYMSTLFLWKIDINGCENISEWEIYRQLSDLGLKRGKLLSAIDTKDIRLEFMTLRDDISYITINFKGTRAQVDITEKKPQDDIDILGEPCDIVSDKAGIILNIVAMEGTKAANEGDTVIPGDLLVSGTVEKEDGSFEKVAASAEVSLRTWREISFAMSTEVYGLKPTGEKKTFYSIAFGERLQPLYFIEKSPYACYYKTSERITPGDDMGLDLPFALIKETYYECEKELLELSEDACADILRSECRKSLESLGVKKVVSESFAFEGGKAFKGVLSAECVENAGVPLKTNQEITGEE